MQSYAMPSSPPVATSAHRVLLILAAAVLGSSDRGTKPPVASMEAPGQQDFYLSPVVDPVFRVGACRRFLW